MKRFFLAAALLLGTVYAASAQFNGCPPGFCSSILGGGGGPAPVLNNLRITNTGDFRVTNTGNNRAVSP